MCHLLYLSCALCSRETQTGRQAGAGTTSAMEASAPPCKGRGRQVGHLGGHAGLHRRWVTPRAPRSGVGGSRGSRGFPGVPGGFPDAPGVSVSPSRAVQKLPLGPSNNRNAAIYNTVFWLLFGYRGGFRKARNSLFPQANQNPEERTREQAASTLGQSGVESRGVDARWGRSGSAWGYEFGDGCCGVGFGFGHLKI